MLFYLFSCGSNPTNITVYLFVCLSQNFPKVATKPLLRPGLTCLHLVYRVVQHLSQLLFKDHTSFLNMSVCMDMVSSLGAAIKRGGRNLLLTARNRYSVDNKSQMILFMMMTIHG